MKRFVRFLIVLVATLSCLPPVSALAFEAEGDVYAGIYDKYLWRGFDLSGGLPVAQGGVDVAIGGFTVSYWSNMQLKNDAGEGLPAGEVNETDLTLDYSFEPGDLVSVSVGNIFYALDGLEDTSELYAGVSFDVIASPSLTAYYDWDKAEKKGLFFVFAVSHCFEPVKGLSVTPGLAISWNEESDYAIGSYSDWHNYEASLGIDYAITDAIGISASYLFSEGISDEARQVIDSESAAGLSVSLSF
ncbi:hypothetical protein EDC39_109115 [Geothermobacter ehrlichii]|uniref:Outer membrane protein n=1 Tax=Geothermobacter ehrlichii TaxID=213224 RepID=A0A5D3WGW4_9BACT|nr:hypothetical protein [Geothermobacter ehrlichii]TYO97711.1 hypothetical protein EDC39_109115 [Geothermobacter ehrlichii]